MNKLLTHVAVGVAALGLGGAAGYLIGKKRANKAADSRIKAINEHWTDRLRMQEGPAAIITSGELIDTPVFDEVQATTAALLEKAQEDVDLEANPMYIDKASELEDREAEIPPDFPEASDEVADDFTVEGLPAPVDARAFVEQFKNRTISDFSGVSYPGSLDQGDLDTDPEDIPVSSVPDFVTVRDPNGPYVISIDEYMDPATDPPFTKVEMRWFAGDNVVVDARDDQVPMSTVGQQNTLRFGEGTTDPAQVYIRNERFSIDIELTREEGLYLHEVLGQDYADKTPILKMRQGDDG